MNFITKAYVDLLGFMFDEHSNEKKIMDRLKNQITAYYCHKCESFCNTSCDCRCHRRSCKNCDEKDCSINICTHECHISPGNPTTNLKNTILTNSVPENKIINDVVRRQTKKLSMMTKSLGEDSEEKKLKAAGKFKKLYTDSKKISEIDKEKEIPELNKDPPRRKILLKFQKAHSVSRLLDNDNLLKSNLARKGTVNIPNFSLPPEIRRMPSNVIEKRLTLENDNLPISTPNIGDNQIHSLINLDTIEKTNSNVWKKSDSPSKMTQNKLSSKKLSDVGKIKKKIQDIGLKGSEAEEKINIDKNNITTLSLDSSHALQDNINLTNNPSVDVSKNAVTKSLTSTIKDLSSNLVPPIEPNNSFNNILVDPNKQHMKKKFDLNNTVLYYQKSKISKDFEIFNSISQAEKKIVEKNLQGEAKNTMSTSDAWQTYNSFIFGDNIHEIKIEPPEELQLKSTDLDKKDTKKMISSSNTLERKDSKKINRTNSMKNR